MINKEFVKKWLEALRSGKYKQGYNRLKDDKDGYCCLGVGVEIAKEMGCEAAQKQKMSGAYPNYDWWTDFIGSNTYLLSMQVHYKGHIEYLSNLNDVLKLSFTEIADLIEKDFLKEQSL